jgi:hypothetical protein
MALPSKTYLANEDLSPSTQAVVDCNSTLSLLRLAIAKTIWLAEARVVPVGTHCESPGFVFHRERDSRADLDELGLDLVFAEGEGRGRVDPQSWKAFAEVAEKKKATPVRLPSRRIGGGGSLFSPVDDVG